MAETIPVRVSKTRYKELRRIAKANGHTISWLLNFAIDVYLRSVEVQLQKPQVDTHQGQAA